MYKGHLSCIWNFPAYRLSCSGGGPVRGYIGKNSQLSYCHKGVTCFPGSSWARRIITEHTYLHYFVVDIMQLRTLEHSMNSQNKKTVRCLGLQYCWNIQWPLLLVWLIGCCEDSWVLWIWLWIRAISLTVDVENY